MSKTLRIAKKKSKNPDEKFPTPRWCILRLLEHIELPAGSWLEPAVGNGAIVRAVNSVRSDVVWTTNDIKLWKGNDYRPDVVSDFLVFGGCESKKLAPKGGFDVCITNPPFSKALDFVKVSMIFSKIVVMLLRLNWLGSAERRDWLVENKPCVYVLPDRPKFGKKASDSCEYAWFVWGKSFHVEGRYFILRKTLLKERQEDEKDILNNI
jgi:hypothetical protein